MIYGQDNDFTSDPWAFIVEDNYLPIKAHVRRLLDDRWCRWTRTVNNVLHGN